LSPAVNDDDAEALRARLAATEAKLADTEADLDVILRVIDCTTSVYRRIAVPLLRSRGLVSGQDDPPAEVV
jgi:hypothetical protein